MTTTDAYTHGKTTKTPGRFRLPDIPERAPDEKMTSYDRLHRFGLAHALAVHLGNPETTLVEADRWIIAAPGTYRELARYPDLLVAFDVSPELYKASNGYIISEQGKPPDFVLEVASESTGDVDVGEKRDDYARLGILEYWRFDETGQFHGTRLAGDRLVNRRYEPIDIDELASDLLQGYSRALGVQLRWERGELALHNPATEEHIATFESERVGRVRAEVRADREWAARMLEREARMRAEAERNAEAARVQELERQLHRLRGD